MIVLSSAVFLVAVMLSMLGQGGGTLYTPIQVLCGIDFHVAAATSLFLIMVTSLSATLVYRKAHKVDWPLALCLESVTAGGGFLGGLYSGRFSGHALVLVFAAVIGVAAVFMARDSDPRRGDRPAPQRSGLAHWCRRLGAQEYTVNLVVALPASFAAGVASGLLGIGGGILKVPLMILLLGIPADIAVGSSAFMVGTTAAGGFAGHMVTGHWDWRTSVILAVAVFAGGQIGARLSLGIDKKKLEKGFGWFLIAMAALLVLREVW